MPDNFLDLEGLRYYHSRLIKRLNNTKSITLALGKTTKNDGGKYYLRPLIIFLNNFTTDDVGTYIYLYKVTSKSGSRHYKHYVHPSHLTDTRIRGLGYGCLATRKMDRQNHVYPAVPFFMHNSGYVPTEWELTNADIERGYIMIDLSRDYTSLIMNATDVYTSSGAWDILGPAKAIGAPKGRSLNFMFAQVDEGKPLLISDNSLRFGIRNSSRLDYIIDLDACRVLAAEVYLRVE